MENPRPSPPIFVVGVPRSGTTLLAAMLGAHPRLVCGPETQFFHFLPEDHDRLCRREDWPGAAIDYLYSIRHVGESIPSNYELTREELAEALARREPSIPSILTGLVEAYADRRGKPRWVEKTPEHLPQVDRIRAYYPDSPIVRIIRDPRAVAASLMAVSWGAGNMYEALSRWWRSYDDRSARFFEVDRNCHTLRYEDLVSDPEPVLKDVCRAIGEPFDPAMLDTSGSARLVNAANEPYKEKVAQKADASRVEAWRETLSEDDLRMAEAWVGDRIRAYGYPAAGPVCPHYVEAYPRSVRDLGEAGYLYLEHHPRGLLDHCPDIVEDLVARGGRFWKFPGERPALSLFLGHPNWWIGPSRTTRRARSARILWTLIRRRLAGVPMAWLGAPEPSEIRGLCASAIARLLPRPTPSHRVPDLIHSGDLS